MKKIYFIRHAKAEQFCESMRDFDREINERGKSDAKLMAEVLRDKFKDISAVFNSDAKRCMQTTKIFVEGLGLKVEPKKVSSFYSANARQILDFIKSLDESLKNIVIVGHNPAITEICEILSDSVIGNIPTSGVFCIKFDGEFKELKDAKGEVEFFEYPKKYK
ncbi:MAG: histidine phosphatase family protein [Campylobacter sp.]|nr:histidine phosphatase family protein [Campylobacter sp.]